MNVFESWEFILELLLNEEKWLVGHYVLAGLISSPVVIVILIVCLWRMEKRDEERNRSSHQDR